MNDVPAHIQKAGADVAHLYAKLMSAGYGHKWAEMCALQQPPGASGTDRGYMEGRLNNQQLDRMPAHQARGVVQMARQAGINISGKYYAAGLADKRGPADPAAWVDSTADVKRVAMDRNLNVSGAVKHTAVPLPRPKAKPLSERLTKEMMRVERANHPSMKSGDLRELVVAKYGRKVKS